MDLRYALLIPYVVNILILVPVSFAMLGGAGSSLVFEGKVSPSRGMELLVGSLWLAILLASVAGLFLPRTMAPLLAMQVIYKATWLALFVLPLVLRGQSALVPWGVSACFVGIVLVWPLFLWIAWRSA